MIYANSFPSNNYHARSEFNEEELFGIDPFELGPGDIGNRQAHETPYLDVENVECDVFANELIIPGTMMHFITDEDGYNNYMEEVKEADLEEMKALYEKRITNGDAKLHNPKQENHYRAKKGDNHKPKQKKHHEPKAARPLFQKLPSYEERVKYAKNSTGKLIRKHGGRSVILAYFEVAKMEAFWLKIVSWQEVYDAIKEATIKIQKEKEAELA